MLKELEQKTTQNKESQRIARVSSKGSSLSRGSCNEIWTFKELEKAKSSFPLWTRVLANSACPLAGLAALLTQALIKGAFALGPIEEQPGVLGFFRYFFFDIFFDLPHKLVKAELQELWYEIQVQWVCIKPGLCAMLLAMFRVLVLLFLALGALHLLYDTVRACAGGRDTKRQGLVRLPCDSD